MVSIIVAVSENGVIGRKGEGMPWHIRADLRHFRKVTMGSRIIMGRATFETLPGALPGRENVVITRQLDFSAEGITVVHSLDRALALPAMLIPPAEASPAASGAPAVINVPPVNGASAVEVKQVGAEAGQTGAEAEQGEVERDEVFVIGGGQIYQAALGSADKLYLTRVHAVVEGDVRFDFDPTEWELESEEHHEADENNEYPYSFLVYRRREFAA